MVQLNPRYIAMPNTHWIELPLRMMKNGTEKWLIDQVMFKQVNRLFEIPRQSPDDPKLLAVADAIDSSGDELWTTRASYMCEERERWILRATLMSHAVGVLIIGGPYDGV